MTEPLFTSPTPEEIRAIRGFLTHAQASSVVKVSPRTWQKWEAGSASMHPGLFKLFGLKRTEAFEQYSK